MKSITASYYGLACVCLTLIFTPLSFSWHRKSFGETHPFGASMLHIPPYEIPTLIRGRLKRHIGRASNTLQQIIEAVICVFYEWTWWGCSDVEDSFVLSPVHFADEVLFTMGDCLVKDCVDKMGSEVKESHTKHWI